MNIYVLSIVSEMNAVIPLWCRRIYMNLLTQQCPHRIQECTNTNKTSNVSFICTGLAIALLIRSEVRVVHTICGWFIIFFFLSFCVCRCYYCCCCFGFSIILCVHSYLFDFFLYFFVSSLRCSAVRIIRIRTMCYYLEYT